VGAALRARHREDRLILRIRPGFSVMPPDARAMPAILPEPATPSADKFSVVLPAGASPDLPLLGGSECRCGSSGAGDGFPRSV